MARITLQIVGNVADIQQRIAQVKQDLLSIGQQPIHFNIDTNGLNAIEQTAIRATNAQARLINAQARMREAENALALAREKTAQETQRRIISENNLATQMERTATAEEQARRANTELSVEIERQNTAAANLALQQERTATAAANLAVQEERTTTETVRLERATTSAGNAVEGFGNRFTLVGRFLQRAEWRMINGVITAISSAFREALKTMREVDQELVVVRKVTGATTSELAALRDRAYETASAYGVAADAYLESVAAFARAGYGDMSADAAELAVKTQLVGDTTAETANQFLISVDKAYKYQGSIEKLSAVLDGANELDNKYATSIEKIAEGMGIVAPIASQVHVEIDELAAAIGTITAVTQRSGAETSRALRALFLNIVGDTKTEIEEGVTWTTGEIAGLQDVIKKYAASAYEAAQATGEVINPMEAMAGLAQSMKEGVLTEQELMTMVSDIGGKLRSSQLLALIQNWDMYQSMLKDYATAVGSADREVQNALTAWDAKTKILKNTWTEFIENLVDTEQIKDGLDTITAMVEGLDTAAGRAAVGIAAIGTALMMVAHMMATNPVGLAILGVAAATAGIVTHIGKAKKEREETAKLLKESRKQLDELQRLTSGSDTGLASNAPGESEDWRLSIYNQAQLAQQERAANMVEIAKTQGYIDYHKSQIADILYGEDGQIKTHFTQQEINLLERYNDLIKRRTADLEALQAKEAEYAEAQQKVNDLLGDYVPSAEDAEEETEGLEEATASLAEQLEAQAAALETLNDEIDKVQSSLQSITAAQEEYNEYGDISVDTLQDLLSLDAEYLDALIDENGQINLNSDAIATLIEGKNVLLERLAAESIATYAAEEAQRLLAIQTGNAATAANSAASAVADAALAALQSGNDAAMGATGWAVFWKAVQGQAIEAGLTEEYREQLYNNVAAYAADVQALLNSTNVQRPGWEGRGNGTNDSDKGGGGDETTKEKTRLDIIKERIKLLESELSLAQERGDSEEYQIDLMRQIQEALHEEADYLRTTKEYLEGDADVLSDVNALSEEWWKYQNKINEAYEKTIEALKDAEDAEYQKLIDAAQAQKDIADENLDIEEKKLAVLKAQADLINAQNERTIRYWNAQTGQWEWAANQKDVQAARDALTSARAGLQDAIQQQYINSLQRTQAASNAAWDSVLTLSPEMQQAVMGGVNNGGLNAGQASGIVTANPTDSAYSMISTSGNSYQGNFGTVYQFGNLQISETQAKNLTVGELATLLGMNLPINSSTY